MREILYKGKRLDNGEWVYGLPYKAKYGCISSIVNDDEERFLVFPETVGQYTGLTDKNGKKIFEGDIVTIPDSKKMGLPALIRYDYVRATFEVSRSGYNPLSLIDAREFYEVIGNIHDNPELLKEGGE